MRIGAHVSSAGGVDTAIDRAQAIGAEAVQIFATAPRAWRITRHSDASTQAFVEKASRASIAPVFLHGVYLVNLGTRNDEQLAKSIESLIHYMNFCERINASGVVFHVGGHGGAGLEAVIDRIAGGLKTVLDRSSADVMLCLENNANRGDQIGGPFAELARIMRAAQDPRLKVCMDTCHAYAAGYDIATHDGLDAALSEFDDTVGLENLVVVHANDSKGVLGGKLDRHENIGDGSIGPDGWRNIVGHPAFRDIPFILEVPGIDGDSGPDKENVDRLKAIRSDVRAG